MRRRETVRPRRLHRMPLLTTLPIVGKSPERGLSQLTVIFVINNGYARRTGIRAEQECGNLITDRPHLGCSDPRRRHQREHVGRQSARSTPTGMTSIRERKVNYSPVTPRRSAELPCHTIQLRSLHARPALAVAAISYVGYPVALRGLRHAPCRDSRCSSGAERKGQCRRRNRPTIHPFLADLTELGPPSCISSSPLRPTPRRRESELK